MKALTQKRNLKTFKKNLLAWYGDRRRDLPWRRTRDPYAIWLSEIMLQQTTVETVIPYYNKFLARFPTIKSVARVREWELLRYWAGLGYYNRIRNFQKAARIVVDDRAGRIPEEAEELRLLPGIGPYTASAIASIAFNKPVAVVDGNVIRVLSRLFAYRKEISTTKAKIFFQSQADLLLDRNRPGDFNQALMELGAIVCLPESPRCEKCPLVPWCEAKRVGVAKKLPLKAKKIVMQDQNYACLIRRKHSKIWLRWRERESVLNGMWELPLIPLARRPGNGHAKPIAHTIMNRRMRIYPIENVFGKSAKRPSRKRRTASKVAAGASSADEQTFQTRSEKSGTTRHIMESNHGGRWVPLRELKKLPLTTVTKKILEQRGIGR